MKEEDLQHGNGIPLRLPFVVLLPLPRDGDLAVARHRRSGGRAKGVCAGSERHGRTAVTVKGRLEQRIMAPESSARLHLLVGRRCNGAGGFWAVRQRQVVSSWW
jgi:hypothetical protein